MFLGRQTLAYIIHLLYYQHGALQKHRSAIIGLVRNKEFVRNMVKGQRKSLFLSHERTFPRLQIPSKPDHFGVLPKVVILTCYHVWPFLQLQVRTSEAPRSVRRPEKWHTHGTQITL